LYPRRDHDGCKEGGGGLARPYAGMTRIRFKGHRAAGFRNRTCNISASLARPPWVAAD